MDAGPIGLRPENLPYVRSALNEARRIAQRTGRNRSWRLWQVAELLAHLDLDKALEVAQSIPDVDSRISAIEDVAKIVARTDPQRAISIAVGVGKARDLPTLLYLLRSIEPASPAFAIATDEATKLARGMKRRSYRDWALARVASSLARLDAEQAMELARSIGSAKERARALRSVMVRIGRTDLARALRLAQSAGPMVSVDDVRVGIARSLAQTAPGRARALVRAVKDPARRARIAFEIALRRAQADARRPRRAPRHLLALARKIEKPAERAQALSDLAEAWEEIEETLPQAIRDELMRTVRYLDYRHWTRAPVAQAVVERDPDAALGIIAGVKNHFSRFRVEERAVVRLAEIDPSRALVLARSLKCHSCRDRALRLFAATRASADADAAIETIRAVKAIPARASLLRGWAEEMAKTDPDRAIATARKESPADVREQMAQGIAETLGTSDVRRAVKVARTIADKPLRFETLVAIAERVLPEAQ